MTRDLNPRSAVRFLVQNVVAVSFLMVFGFGDLSEPATADETLLETRQKIHAEIQQAMALKRPSRSVGTLRDGRLENAAELPKPDGIGYFISHVDRDTNFGADRMIFGLLQLGLTLRERLGPEPQHRVLVSEISDRDGGKQLRHINHQMGLDVDLGFYTMDRTGKPETSKWLMFDKEGLSPNKTVRFDTERNWLLIESILENETFGEIRTILIADWLKTILLEHAEGLAESANDEEAKRIRLLIRRGERLMRQPSSSPHDNHLHLSLELLPNEMEAPGCVP